MRPSAGDALNLGRVDNSRLDHVDIVVRPGNSHPQ